MKQLLLVMFVAGWYQPTLAQVDLVDAFPNLMAFDKPVDLQHAGDGSGRLYVLEQDGTIRAFDNDETVSRTDIVLDIRDRVRAPFLEEGLLGLAFHPQYEENDFFFVYYIQR